MDAAFTASDLTFDAVAHTYTLPDSRRVPSVTTILRSIGISTDFEALAAMGDRLRERIEWRRALGTAIHADAHAWDDQELVESSVHPDVVPFLEAWKVFRANTRLTPLTRERRVFHPTQFYCGTLDGIFRKPDGRSVLIDLKIGDPKDCGADLQTAAYLAAWQLENPLGMVHERWAVQLTTDNAIPYRITPYGDYRDFARFANVVATFHELTRRRPA